MVLDKIVSLIFKPAGKYPHNPLVGPRPMKYPYTVAASIAQFPYVFYWRYSKFYKSLMYALIVVELINFPITRLVQSPANVEEWRQRRKEWYAKKIDPEDPYF